jgi:hypothetical protein
MPYSSPLAIMETQSEEETCATETHASASTALNCPYCAQHLIPNEVHGHTACFACGQVIEGCCGDGLG